MTRRGSGPSGPAEAGVEEETVRRALNQIVDPCSVAAGCPAGLVDMGLVTSIRVGWEAGGAVVDVTLVITEPGCLMAAPFTVQATEALESLTGVSAVTVKVDPAAPWDESDMAPDYLSRLTAHRARRRRDLGLEPVR